MASEATRPSVSSLDVNLNGQEASPESFLRKRLPRDPSPDDSLEAGDLSDALSDDEDVPGCPLPSTPEDTDLLEAEVSEAKKLFLKLNLNETRLLSASLDFRWTKSSRPACCQTRLTWVHWPTMLLSRPRFLSEKCGRLRGKLCTSRTYRTGCKTTTSFTKATVRHSLRSVLASNQFSDCTRKQEIFGECVDCVNNISTDAHLPGLISLVA